MTFAAEAAPTASAGASLASLYRAVRQATARLCEPLAADDYLLQSMPEASPDKWHLAHTSWFFETFVLGTRLPGYRPLRPEFGVLFNSYYGGRRSALASRSTRASCPPHHRRGVQLSCLGGRAHGRAFAERRRA